MSFVLKDGIILEDSSRIVLNQYSFCELIKHLLVHYVGISYPDASEIVEHSYLTRPVKNAMDAGLLSHEFPYYWAMLLYYGPMYWKKGVPAQPEDMTAYFSVENDIIKRYGLKEPLEYD